MRQLVGMLVVLVAVSCGGDDGGAQGGPPAAPNNLTVQAGDGEVTLSWAASDGATGYRVLRAGSSGGAYASIATPSTTSYTDTGLTNETTYFYVVRAMNDRDESPDSAEASATPRALVSPPAAPTNLTATAADAQVTLSWNASTEAASYEVQRDAGCTGSFTTVATPVTTSHVDSGLTNGTTYCYVVRAKNAAGTSAVSNQASATPQTTVLPPAAPANLTATPGDGQVALSWSASAGATSYEVQRDPGCIGSFTTVATPATTSHTDTSLTNGTAYCYVVKAKNAAGTSAASNQASATPASASAPLPPANLVATPGNAQVVLTWTASAGATAYVVERGTTTGGPYSQLSTPTATTFTDATAANGRTYFYVVRAMNGAGTSGRSAEVSATPLSGRELCVTNESAHTMAVFDPTSAGDVAPLRRLGNLTGMNALQGVAFDRTNDEIYVAHATAGPRAPAYAVTVYGRTASGNVAPLRVLAGSATGLTTAVALAVDPAHNELFVVAGGVIRVFPRTANGNVAPLRSLDICVGCAPGIAVDPGHNELFVPIGNTIAVYARTATGNAAPLRTIGGSFTELASPTSVTYDAVHDELITTSTNSAIGVFPRLSSGNAFPTRTIYADSPANLTGIVHAAVDDVTGDIYVAASTSVAVFPRTADQGVPPARTITGSNVGFTRPLGIAVSPATGEVFIGDGSDRRLAVHATTASGNVAPLRTISGTSGGLNFPTSAGAAVSMGYVFVASFGATGGTTSSVTSYLTPWTGAPTPTTTLQGAATGISSSLALAVDAINGELFVTSTSGGTASVTVHMLTSSGNTAPVRNLSGPLTGLSGPLAVDVDPTNDELLVANGTRAITVFGRTASGNTAPVRTLGPSMFVQTPAGIAVDPAHDELFVLSVTGTTSEVVVFSRTAAAGTAPLRTISGPATQLSGASDILVDAARNEIYVTNSTSNAITVYSRTASGDVAPLRTIAGPSTWLASPSGIAACK